MTASRPRAPAWAHETSPSLSAFAAVYDAGKAQVVWTTLVADLETPVSAFLKLADGRANSFLFESVEGGEIAAAIPSSA